MAEYDSPSARALRGAGYKLTTPRLTILDILEKHGGHLTSSELLKLVEQRDPGIGRASVFRTLDLMIKVGIIWTTVQGGSTVHYMLMPGGHHHHIICTNCHKLIEFEDCRLGPLIHAMQERYGVRVDGHLLELYGLCSDCRTAEALGVSSNRILQDDQDDDD
jgi:Fur family ferric uptake transcriptional regulator